MKHSDTTVLDGLRIESHEAPLIPKQAKKIDAFLLNIFSYGDYDFRSAMSGLFGPELKCTFFTAERNGTLIGAAACLQGRDNPRIAIVGPVAVAKQWRNHGVGGSLISAALDWLKSHGAVAAYLGVRQDNRAVNLYGRMGFEEYQGIVMRKFLADEREFAKCYQGNKDVSIRKLCWGNFPAVMALATMPADMYTVDLREGIFSSRYVQPDRFLSVFPKMTKTLEECGGLANVLLLHDSKTVVGIARVHNVIDRCEAELEFFAHDNFLDQAPDLVQRTMQQSGAQKVVCRCLACDMIKRAIIESAGGKVSGVLPQNVRFGDMLMDVTVYQIRPDGRYFDITSLVLPLGSGGIDTVFSMINPTEAGSTLA